MVQLLDLALTTTQPLMSSTMLPRPMSTLLALLDNMMRPSEDPEVAEKVSAGAKATEVAKVATEAAVASVETATAGEIMAVAKTVRDLMAVMMDLVAAE